MGFLDSTNIRSRTYLPMEETKEMWVWIRPPGREDPPEEGMATSPVFSPEKPMDRGAWQAMVPRVTKSGTRRSD